MLRALCNRWPSGWKDDRGRAKVDRDSSPRRSSPCAAWTRECEMQDTEAPQFDADVNEPRINVPEWTVSELSAALRRTVEDTYGHVRVRGEISGYRGPHSSGHAYFALKDEGARIDAVVWKGVFGRMRIKPEEG